jgi:hypothetical protein
MRTFDQAPEFVSHNHRTRYFERRTDGVVKCDTEAEDKGPLLGVVGAAV